MTKVVWGIYYNGRSEISLFWWLEILEFWELDFFECIILVKYGWLFYDVVC